MGYDWAFENYLKHGLVHRGIPWKEGKVGQSLVECSLVS
jgi:hypothetical protein